MVNKLTQIAGHPDRKTRWETQIPDPHQCIHPPFHLHHRGKLGFPWGDGRRTDFGSSSTGYKTKPWESFREQQRTHPLRPCATYWTCHPRKQDIRWSKSRRISMLCRIPSIHSTMLSKKKRGVEWQEASHGWAEQNNQSSMCALSQSSSK